MALDRSAIVWALFVKVMIEAIVLTRAVYGGYESLRVRRIRPGDDTLYAPHASRCTYAWPRSFYLTISYRF